MIMKKIQLLLICLSLICVSHAQSTDVRYSHHALGFQAGGTTGVGLSYQYWPTRFGLQVTTGPFYSLRGNTYLLSSGITGLFTIVPGKYIDLFGYLGQHLIAVRSKQNVYIPNSFRVAQEIVYKMRYNLGLGLGVRWHMTKRMDVSAQCGYGIFNIGGYSRNSLTVEAGIHWKLKAN